MNGSYKVKTKMATNRVPVEKSKAKDKKPWKSEQKQQQKRNWITGE